MSDKPSIWIGDLAAYNAGYLVGDWVELDTDTTEDEVLERIGAILARGDHALRRVGEWSGPHEEWHICDYENFGPVKIDRYEAIAAVLAHVERMGDDPAKYFAWIDVHGEDEADAYSPDKVDGPYESEDDPAWNDLNEVIGELTLPQWLAKHGMPANLAMSITFDADQYAQASDADGSGTMTLVGTQYYRVGY
ncbi:ArdA-like antirestriction protein [Gordonia phage Octobien14]|uniref:ArdA-like antirestriction protein n=1 Tax=Gordonia phage Octobien14 TaxID=2483673 RepID=A0A3G3MB17_9CAUD|nr:anti-restriction protein [Gordonia phage Octobien14]AYR03268.1 ArdA-like antirestriction protein [Gordonia phage Octobien14]